MSILIKGMEMPSSCYACIFFTETAYWNEEDEADTLSYCKRTGEKTWECVNRYLPNCPLIPVPPHGRLIDADILLAYCEEMQSIEWNSKAAPYSWAYAYESFEDDIDIAPTIIEAEEKK